MNKSGLTTLFALAINAFILWTAVDSLAGFQKWFLIVVCAIALVSNVVSITVVEPERQR